MEHEELVAKLKGDSRIEYLHATGAKGDRHLIHIKLADIVTDDLVKKLRKEDPNINLLKTSIKSMGNEPLQFICLFVREKDGKLVFVLGDGHQRLNAMVGQDQKWTFALVIEWWKGAEDAVRDGISLASARYNLSDSDLMSILANTKVSVEELAKLTGKSKSTIERFNSICNFDWMVKAVDDGFLGYVAASKLIDICGSNTDKLKALETSFKVEYDKATTEAKDWAKRFAEKKRNYDKETLKRKHVSFYGKDIKWDEWESAIGDVTVNYVNACESDSQPLVLPLGKPDENAGKIPPVISNRVNEWESQIAMRNVEGTKFKDIATEDLKELVEKWEWAGEQIQAALDRRLDAEANKKHPLKPNNNPRMKIEKPAVPEKQDANMSAGNDAGKESDEKTE